MTNDRIQDALDGRIPLDQLTADEAEAFFRLQASCNAALRQIEGLRPIDVTGAVLSRVGGRPASSGRLGAAAGWLWAPRPLSFSIRPAFALAAAVALALATWSVTLRPSAPPPVIAAGDPPRILVQFRLGAADASSVELVGDFNGWRPAHRLLEVAPGVWSVEVALEPGVYNYGFMVDGSTWRLDPLAPQVTDGFGGASSRVAVLPPEHRL